MLLFVIINPDLKLYPYQFELEKIQTGNYLSVLENLISKNEKPAHSDLYCRQHALNCLRLRKLYDQCTRFHPRDRPDAEYIADFLCNEEQPVSRNLTQTVSQGSSVENANCSNVPEDGTNSCAFMSVHFGDLLMRQNERPVSTFEDIAHLAEEVIINFPLRFNPIREQSQHYDVSEEILSNHGVYSACVREELTAAEYQLTTETQMRPAFYSCWGHIFAIGWAFGNLFITDTHAMSTELGGNGKGLVKVFLQEHRQLAAESVCLGMETTQAKWS